MKKYLKCLKVKGLMSLSFHKFHQTGQQGIASMNNCRTLENLKKCFNQGLFILVATMATATVALLAITPTSVNAKDLSRRLGVGYANQFGLTRDLPSIAMRYYPNSDYGVMGAIGVDTEEDNARFGFQAKFLRIIFKEDNLNFYIGAGAGVVSNEESGSTDSGFDLSGFVGVEFFFAGLDNLSFNFEAGAGVTSVSNEVRFRTIGDHPLRAGIFFYF